MLSMFFPKGQAIFSTCKHRGGAFLQALLDLIFPPRCPSCGIRTLHQHTLCGDCWQKLHFIADNSCQKCSYVFAEPAAHPRLCLRCIKTSPTYDQVTAVLKYDEISRDLLLRFKHGDRLDLALPIARMMATQFLQRFGAQQQTCLVIMPIPLHWTRFFKRRYNQAALLARHIAHHLEAAGQNVSLQMSTLQRIRSTKSQGKFSRHKRFRNLQGAFSIKPKHRNALQNAHILLIDDVMTSGATVETCARILKKQGTKRIDILIFARA